MAALKSLRVLEIGSLPAASYCARLFADFSADVLKLEPDGGDPLRRAAPLFEVGGTPTSAWWTFLNFGKRVAPQPRSEDALVDLVRASDIVVCADDAITARIKALTDAPICIDVSWFGRTGPYARFAGTDAICRALGGNTQLIGPAEGPPIASPDFQAAIAGGLWAFIGAASALLARERDGSRTLETSVHEACVTLAEYQVTEAVGGGAPQQRLAINRFAPTYPLGIYPAADGWIGVTLVTPAQWRSFCDMVDLPHLARDETLHTSLDRLSRADELEAQFIPKLREAPAAHWFAEGLKRKIPLVVVPQMDALTASPEFRTRGAIVPLTIGDTEVLSPGCPLRLTGTPPRAGGTVEAAATADWTPRDTAPVFPSPKAPAGALPLSGVRIVDFTMGWAGPLCTRTFADLGADVVKIESCSYPDWWRGVDRRPHVVREKLYEKQSRFTIMNRNKRGTTIDLTQPDGVALVKDLILTADAVADNYSVDVLPKFGLGPQAMRDLKPSLVTLSMSAFGSSSPWRECRAYGSTLEQGSGLPQLVGRPGDIPVMSHPAFGDPVGGLNGAAALLVALLHARRTGEGQHIDLSQIECMMQMTAPWMIAQSAGAPLVRYGGGHPDHAPHGIYPCVGEEAWIAIAVRDEHEWHTLCDVIGRADLATDPALGASAARQDRHESIDAAIEDWTKRVSADEAMMRLQARGIAAGVVRRPIDLVSDPHLQARAFWQPVERAYTGLHPQPSPAIREGAKPYASPVSRADARAEQQRCTARAFAHGRRCDPRAGTQGRDWRRTDRRRLIAVRHPACERARSVRRAPELSSQGMNFSLCARTGACGCSASGGRGNRKTCSGLSPSAIWTRDNDLFRTGSVFSCARNRQAR